MLALRCISCHHLTSMHSINGCICIDLGNENNFTQSCFCSKTLQNISSYVAEKYEIAPTKKSSYLQGELANIRNQALMLGTSLSVIASMRDEDFSDSEKEELIEMMQNMRNKLNFLMNNPKE